MKTIVLQQPGQFALTDTAAPTEPGPGEVLVRVHRVGVCGTDLHAFAGRQPFFDYPRVLGHELGVEVVTLGEGVSNLSVGDRCAVEPYLNCGECIACRRGKSNCCVELKVLGVHIDGGMCEMLCLPADKLHPSTKLSIDQLALVETLGIGCHAVSRGAPCKGEFVLVTGVGPIGLTVCTFAREAGARVIAMDINTERLEFCRQQLGVEFIVDASDDPRRQLENITGGDMPTLAFDATGHLGSMRTTFDLVAPGGRLVYVGLAQGDVTFPDPDFHRRELTIHASRNSTGQDFRRIIDLIERGRVDTRPWITHRSSFADTTDQFPTWTDPACGVIKAIIEVE